MTETMNEQAGETLYTMMLPCVFLTDHDSRLSTLSNGHPDGGEGAYHVESVERIGVHYRVTANRAAFMEILDDARFYADKYGPAAEMGADGKGLRASARATVRRIEGEIL